MRLVVERVVELVREHHLVEHPVRAPAPSTIRSRPLRGS